MPVPLEGDLIDLHTHGSRRKEGVFAIENLMMHEDRTVDDSCDAWSAGIHPWYLEGDSMQAQLDRLAGIAADKRVVAIGEAGYDRGRGPDAGMQRQAFEAQARLAGELSKPLIIHCIRGWDELLASGRRLKPASAWIVHGFNGGLRQAQQLIDHGMYLSMWVKSVLNGKLAPVMQAVEADRIFLESDGFGTDMAEVYGRAAVLMDIGLPELVGIMHDNYRALFGRGR